MKNQYEEYVEYQARIIIQKISTYIIQLFYKIRVMLNDFSTTMRVEKRENLLKPGIYFPIGLLLAVLGVVLLLRSKNLFSPDYIVYFFLTVFFTGIFLLRKKL